jgi:hypothetical protein
MTIVRSVLTYECESWPIKWKSEKNSETLKEGHEGFVAQLRKMVNGDQGIIMHFLNDIMLQIIHIQ